MMLSDIDAGGFKREDRFQGIFLLIFMVFISTILFNLLNALTISDTNEILKVAEFVDIKMRIGTIQTYERLLQILKLNYLNIFPKMPSITLTPIKDCLLKVASKKTSTHPEKLFGRNERFELLHNELILRWRGKYAKFEQKFIDKVLDFVKNRAVMLEEKENQEKTEKYLEKRFQEISISFELLQKSFNKTNRNEKAFDFSVRGFQTCPDRQHKGSELENLENQVVESTNL